MIRICCCCREILGEKEPLKDKSETETYCDTCLQIAKDNKFDREATLEAVRRKIKGKGKKQ
jgi:hypothetical protein